AYGYAGAESGAIRSPAPCAGASAIGRSTPAACRWRCGCTIDARTGVRVGARGFAARAPTCHDRCVEAVLWIVLAVALAIAEAFTATFLIIFFAVGALAAAGAAALGAPLLLQVIVFAIVSALSVGTIRPIITRHQ